MLRFSSANQLVLVDRNASTPRWTGKTIYAPNREYRIGVARTGNRLAFCVNDEAATVDIGAALANTVLRPLRGSDDNGQHWSGHLQKAIFWAGGRGQADLARLVDRWL